MQKNHARETQSQSLNIVNIITHFTKKIFRGNLQKMTALSKKTIFVHKSIKSLTSEFVTIYIIITVMIRFLIVLIYTLFQICPFPYDLFVEQVQKFPSAEVVWAQEEHKNQGWWCYVQPRIASVLGKPLG